jgi:hypothetical protein
MKNQIVRDVSKDADATFLLALKLLRETNFSPPQFVNLLDITKRRHALLPFELEYGPAIRSEN